MVSEAWTVLTTLLIGVMLTRPRPTATSVSQDQSSDFSSPEQPGFGALHSWLQSPHDQPGSQCGGGGDDLGEVDGAMSGICRGRQSQRLSGGRARLMEALKGSSCLPGHTA